MAYNIEHNCDSHIPMCLKYIESMVDKICTNNIALDYAQDEEIEAIINH